MSKKFLLIIGIILIIGVAAFLVLSSRGGNGEGDSRVGFSIRDYFPFGNSDSGSSGEQTRNTETNTEEEVGATEENSPIKRLRKISNDRVAGAVIYNVGTTTFVRFVEKGTGNVYEARSDRNRVERITNTTIPKVVSASWLPDGSGFLAQTIDVANDFIETSFVKLSKSSISNENAPLYTTTISSLPTDMEGLSISPDGKKIFYYLKGASSFWFVANPDGTSKKNIYISPILEITPTWLNNTNIFIQTKPALNAETFAYKFDTVSGKLTKTSVSGFGLSFNPKGDITLVSNGGFNISVVDKNLNSTSLNTNTLSEKCVWFNVYLYCAIPEGNISGYMDAWYKGLISTKDNIRRIDTENLFYSNIVSLSESSGEDIDISFIDISNDGSHLIFTNKIDEHLWMLRVE